MSQAVCRHELAVRIVLGHVCALEFAYLRGLCSENVRLTDTGLLLMQLSGETGGVLWVSCSHRPISDLGE